jgi:putative hydroxymethylpyrimidine transport system substrate-binding protein
MKKLRFVFNKKCIILLLLVIVGFSISCGRSTVDKDGKSKVTVALDWYINPDHGPLLVAQAMGYFKENGVNISFITPTETSAPSQLVCAGNADVALVYEPQFIAQLAGGMPLDCAGTLINKILCCVAVLKDSDMQKLFDLKGKTIGYSSDGTDHAILGAMLEYSGLFNSSYGVKLKQVNLVNLQMNLSQALLSKRVSAVYGMMRNVEPIQLEQQGVETKLFYPEDYGVPMYSELLFVVKKTHAKDEKIINFLKSVKQGVDYINRNSEKSWNLIAGKFRDSLAMTPKMRRINHDIWNATIKYFAPNPEVFNKKQFNVFARFLCKKGTISEDAMNQMLY